MPVRVFRGVCGRQYASHEVTRLASPSTRGVNGTDVAAGDEIHGDLHQAGGDARIMVYVTGSLLHIEQLSPALRHVVTIDLLHHTQLESTNGVTSDGSGILAVAADPYARVAVSIGCKVVVLQLDMESATYTETATFTAAAPVTSLSWNGRSRQPLLLCGGQTLMLWREIAVDTDHHTKQFALVWSFRCIAESFLAKFSPDGELFATVSKYDRRVKIWAEHKTSGQDKTPQLAPSPTSDASVKPLAPGVKYSFTYLVHPRAVTNFIWRHNSQFAITQDPPVLLTNCVDSVARLWAQSNSQFGHFVLITSIDARTFPGAEQQQHHHHPPPAVNGYGDGHTISSESVHSLTPATPSGIAFLHWLDKDELLATVNVAAQKNSLVKVGTVEKAPRPPRQKHVEPSSSTLSLLLPDLSEFGTDENTAQPTENIQTARKRVLEMVQGYDDIIFTVQMNGSFLVWGVQRLFQTPRTIPKVLAVMRLAASLLPSDYDYFTTPTAVYHPPAAPHSPALTSQDIELHMIAANVDTGALRCYSINLADVFVNRPGAKIALRKEWNGHSDDAGIAYKPHSLRSVHPIGSHFVATRLGSEAVVWQLEGRNRGLRRSEGLVELLRMEDLTEREQLVTFGGAPYFGMTFPTDDHGLRVFHARMLERERSVDVKEIGVLSTTSARFSECFYAVSSPESLVVGADEPAVPTKCRLLMLHRQSLDLTTLNFEIALGGAVSIVDEQTRCLRDCCPAISDVCHTAFIHSSAALVSSAQRERIYEFVTLSSDGALRLWRANSTENAWQVVSETRILDPVADVKEVTACMRKVAIAFVDRIRIYDISILQNTLHLEYTVPSQEPVIAASLYPAITGLSFLAYATPDSMHILAPYPDTKMSGSMDLVWRQVASPTLLKQQKCRAEDTLSAMRWVGTGDLIAFCGDMVIRGDKWTVSPSEWTGPVATYTPHLHHLPHQLSSLPSYHPHLLMQYLLWNKFDLTKHTLTQLYYYLRGTFGEVISENMGKSHPVLVIPSPVGPKMEELLSDKSSTGLPNEQFSAGNMFGDADASDSDLLDMNAYTQDKATYLTSALANINLPFLDAVDQQRLIAVTETVLQLESQRQSLDANGVRYVLFLRIFLHLQKSPMPADRPEAMTSEGISWGFFSESQDVLVQNCVSQYENALTWPRARALGMGWWVHNLDTLKTLAETIARNTYVQDERNPVGCSLLYLALRKRKLLLGLWKQAAGHAEQGAMSNFLSKDFDDERWKTAALKNAFVLLGRQRHEYAAAFFLLGDSLKDAVSVCLKQLNDPQLAIVLCRLYQGDSSDVLKQILSTQVLPDMVERGDRFLTVMVLWLMREKDQALRATLQPTSAATDTALTTSPTLQTDRVSPQLWILYKHVSQYMRKHHHTNYKLSTGAENAAVSDVISFYEARGCPSLALYVFQQWQAERAEGDHAPAGSVRRTAAKQVSADITGILDIDDWGKPASPVEAAPDTSAFDALFGDGPAAKRNNANDDFDSMFGGSGSGNTKPDDDFDRMFKSDKAVEDDLFGAPSVQAADPAPTAPAPAQAGTDAEPAVEFTEQQMAWCRERIFSRSLWPLAESAKAIGHNRTMFAKELFFEDYQLRLKDGFAVLCNVVQVDQGTAQHLLVQLCRVAHLTRHLVELGLCDMVHYEGYAGELAELLLDTTHAVSVLTVDDIRFGKGFKDIFLLNVANELLQSLYRVSDPRPFDVQRIHGPGIITALSILTLCMIEVRNYRAMMLLFRHTGAVYDALSTDRYQNIRGVLQPIADNIEALMHPYQPPPTEEMDSYSAEGSGPVVIIQYLALRYLIQPLELFLEANRSTLPDDSVQFVQHTWCFTLFESAHKLQQQIIERITASMIKEFYDYIFDSDLLELWEALKSWTFDGRVIDNMLLRKDSALLQQAQEAKSSDADEATPAQPATHEYRKEIVVQSEVPVWALGIDRSNPRYAAFSFPKVVVEIDIEKSWKFSKAQLKNKRDKSGSPPGVAATPPIDVPSTSLDEKASTLARSAPMSHDLAVPIPPSPPSTLRRQTETIIATLKRKDTTSSKRTELQRVQSTDDLQTLRRRTLSTGNRPEPDPNAPGVDPSYSLRRPGGSTWIESHPSLPYYISCMTDSQGRTLLNAYEFGQPEILGSIAHGSGKASRVRFDRYGERFGVVDDAGVLSLYRFEPTAYNGRTPFFLLPCHSRYASDLAFLDSDSVVASAGSSPGHINNIAIWDTLLPAHKALVKGFHIHESGASALAYDRQRHMLYSAGKKGDMAVIDIRQHAIVKTFQAHSHLIQTLAMDEHHGVVMSGSSDGNIKLWDLQTFADVGHLKQVHAAKRFITPSLEKAPVTMYGITEISCSEYYAMTCGADGNVHLLKHEP